MYGQLEMSLVDMPYEVDGLMIWTLRLWPVMKNKFITYLIVCGLGALSILVYVFGRERFLPPAWFFMDYEKSLENDKNSAILEPGTTASTSPNVVEDIYPIHRNITATIFWVGEPEGGGSSEDNAFSAWDDAWLEHYGGYDDPFSRNGYFPSGFVPKENPFYLDLPYNDFDDDGKRKANAYELIPWANERDWGPRESMLKNRWVKLMRNGVTCYGQIEDAGPYEYDDHAYVFGTDRPKSTRANNAGMDVSPALRDCLKFEGLNNDDNHVDWQFVGEEDVPIGPWKEIVTTSQIYWR